MGKNKPRRTDAWIQEEEGRFDPVVEAKSKYVPIENVPSGDLNPEEICILCEQFKKMQEVTDPEVLALVEELIAAYKPEMLPPKPSDECDPPTTTKILVAKGPLAPAHGRSGSHSAQGQKKFSRPPSVLALLVMLDNGQHIPDDEE
jgi:hypothetical protein